MKASALRRVTLIVVSLMVSGCAVLRPQTDAMNYSAVPAPRSMSTSSFTPLDTNLPFAHNFDTALRQAQDLRKSGKLDDASRVLAQLVLASPDDPRVIGEYGKVMLESGRMDDAVAFLERAVSLQPSDWTLFSALGVAYDQSGKAETARASFHRALALKPGEPTILSNLALSHLQSGELDEAERLLLQASEQGKDVPGIAAKLAMVRNIRTTTAQSRPLAVSTLPQPIAPPSDSGTQSQAPVASPAEPAVSPVPTEAAPVPTNEPAAQGPVEDEYPPTPEDVEQEIAVTAPPAAIIAPVSHSVKMNKTNELRDNSKVSSEYPARAGKSPAKRATNGAIRSTSKSRQVSILSVEAKVKTKQGSATEKAPTKAVAAVKPETAKLLPAPAVVAPRISSIQAKPLRAPATVASLPAAQIASAAVPAAKIPEPTANPTPQAAIMTRRADVATAVSRTAPVPLVLAPARDSWETMVRVSLPPASDAGPKPIARADQGNTARPAAKPASWSDVVTGWVTAAFGFISAFWA